jgi:DNA polymerase IV
MKAMARAILHVDMDAFYASVEERDDPALRGRPLVVGGASRRGVVCAASYEARKFGVRSAMPMTRAHALCKELVVVPPDFHKYAAVSEQVFGIFHGYTPEVEGLSLDEAFLDVTRSQSLFGPARGIGEAIQRKVREETRLGCSVGLAEVKFAAKIASDLRKPNGFVEVPQGGVQEFLAPLPVSRLWGVGPRTEEGSSGPWMQDLALGLDERGVEPDRQAKSIGAEETFEEDYTELADLLPMVHEQALRVAARMRASQLTAGTLSVKVKYSDFQIASRQGPLDPRTDDGAALYRAASALLEKMATGRPIRLTGVSASDLGPAGAQLRLFDAQEQKRSRLNKSLDAIAAKFGEKAVAPADVATKAGRTVSGIDRDRPGAEGREDPKNRGRKM